MQTKMIVIRDKQYRDLLREAADILMSGGLVAFPTETVYGLGADALNPQAAKKIYAAKGRPSDNPLIVHIADEEEMGKLAREVPEMAKKLAQAFWPGPMTLVMKKREIVPLETSGGLDTVGIRMPSNEIARSLIRLAKTPIAAPSANTSGRPSPTQAEHVWEDLNGKVNVIIDGGPVGIGLESTIIDVTGSVPMILRPGAITMEMVKEVVGKVELDPTLLGSQEMTQRPKAPGMKYRHYAPKAELFVVEGKNEKVVEKINALIKEAQSKKMRIGLMVSRENRDRYPNHESIDCVVLGSREDEAEVARHLFATLREFDHQKVDIIYAESFSGEGMAMAVMNRLMKAAGQKKILV